jgi:hypothetical protein
MFSLTDSLQYNELNAKMGKIKPFKFAYIAECQYIYGMKEQVLDMTSALDAINGKIDSLTIRLDTAVGEIVVLKKENTALRVDYRCMRHPKTVITAVFLHQRN